MSSQTTREELRSFDPATEENLLAEHCEALVERAQRAGADQAEAYGVRSEGLSVEFQKDELKLAQVEEGGSLGLRVVKDGRIGFASTNQMNDDSLGAVVRDAVALAKISPPDPANDLLGSRALPPDPGLFNPGIAALGIEDAIASGKKIVETTTARDERISLNEAKCEVGCSARAIHSSQGVQAQCSDAVASLSVFGMAIDGEDVGGFDYDWRVTRDPVSLDRDVTDLVGEFSERALGNLAAGRGETYQGPVLFSPDAFLEVFLAPLAGAASAVAVQRGRSGLADKLNEAIATPELNLWDDPTDRSLYGVGFFDREGQPMERTSLVEEGVLRTYLYNGYAARVEGRDSTGHATGGPRGVPGLGTHALSAAGGSGGTLEDLMGRMGTGLYIQRFSGTVKQASGDFSGVAKSARWVQDGAVVRSVKEVLIAGNIFELLKRVDALSDEAPAVMSSSRAPWALMDGVSVTAG